jgi:hypothetical protein
MFQINILGNIFDFMSIKKLSRIISEGQDPNPEHFVVFVLFRKIKGTVPRKSVRYYDLGC